MKNNIKFVHCSDIHLGANPFGIEERFEDMGNALKQVFQFAIDEKVDFVLIAGDFFHNKQLEPKTLEQAINLLEILKKENILVFLTEGNHDMPNYATTYGWLQFLSSKGYIHLLKPIKNEEKKYLQEWNGNVGSYYELEDTIIVGLGYPGSTAHKYIQKYTEEIKIIRKENKDKNIIVMLHTGINRFLTESMAGLKEEEIYDLIEQIDYLALGHIHTRYENVEKKYFNPGSLECVRISDNPFEKGFYFVEIKNEKLETNFKTIQNRNSLRIELDIKKLNKEKFQDEILEKITEEYTNIKTKEKIMLQLKLTGNAQINTYQINQNELAEAIKQKLPILHLEIVNEINYQDEEEIMLQEYTSREEIDRAVLKDKIQKAGFEGNEEEVFSIIDKIKEYCHEEAILLDSSKGEDIENMLLEFVEEGKYENK